MGKVKKPLVMLLGRIAALLLLSVFFVSPAEAQYVAPYVGITGTLSSSNGMPAPNFTITFDPTQVMFVGGTSAVVGNSYCGTDSGGQVVGMKNPLTAAVLSTSLTGTLPAGNYYVRITWYDTYAHQTLPSLETQVQLLGTGSIVVSPPAATVPPNAIGMDVYIGSSAGSETYQGQTTSTTSTFTQSAPLVTGASLPILNNSVCQVVANDAAWPIAGYTMTVTDTVGNTVAGFPLQVQFIGPGSAFNISNGLPIFNGRVTYPVPVLTIPYNHNAQSISGPLSMTGYNLYNVGALGVGTALPAYGVDVEGTGAPAAINANQGFVVNGGAGTIGQCLASDGTYFDTPQNCVTALPTLYYQTVDANGVAQTQRPVLNFSSQFAMTDSASPAETTAAIANSGVTAGSYTCVNATVGADGRVTAMTSGSACPASSTWQNEYGSLTGCAFPNDGGGLNCAAGTITWPAAFSDINYTVGCWTMYSAGIAGGSSTQPVIDLNATITDSSHVSITEGVAQGSAGGYLVASNYGLTILCEGHHN